MKKGRLRLMLHLFGIAALTSAVSTAPASAQNSDDCRCVDPQGNAIESCSCFRASPLRDFVLGFAPQVDTRPRIGISVDMRQSARNDARGARVISLADGGPAEDAGIRVGDMITSVDGHSLFEPLSGNEEDDFDLDASVPVQRLLTISADLEEGQEVDVEYVRGGESQTTTLEARELSAWDNDSWDDDSRRGGWNFARPSFEFRSGVRELQEHARELAERAQQEARRGILYRQAPDVHVFLGPDASGRVMGDHLYDDLFTTMGMGGMYGIDLLEMKPGLASYFGTEDGMLVTNVDEDSTLGLEPGDVILSIGDREATSSSRIRRILSTYDEDEDITLRIMRDHDEMTVTGRLGG